MTTTVLVHNNHRVVRVVTEDQVYDHDKKVMTNEWREVGTVDVPPGQLYTTYCTDTRRLSIIEPPIEK